MNKTAKTVLYVGGGLAAAGVVYSLMSGGTATVSNPALTGPVTNPNTGQAVQPPPENTARDFNSFNKHLAAFRRKHPKRWRNMQLHGLDCADGLGDLGNWRNRRHWWRQQQANAGYPGGPAGAVLPGYGGWGGYGLNPSIPGDFGDAPPPREVITGQPYGGGYSPYGGFPGSFYDGSYGDY